MFTRFWWNQSWAASLFASAWHWSTITAVTRQKVGGIDGHKSAVSKSLHKLDLGLSCIHATEFNQKLQVLFLTQPTLHAVTYNQRFGVTRAMLLLSQVLKFLLLLVKVWESNCFNKHSKDHQRLACDVVVWISCHSCFFYRTPLCWILLYLRQNKCCIFL